MSERPRQVPIAGTGLRLLRVRRGLTQLSLATKISVSQVTVSRWERGARKITPDSAARLLAVLLDGQAEAAGKSP